MGDAISHICFCSFSIFLIIYRGRIEIDEAVMTEMITIIAAIQKVLPLLFAFNPCSSASSADAFDFAFHPAHPLIQ